MLSIILSQDYCFSNLRIAVKKKKKMTYLSLFFLSLSLYLFFTVVSRGSDIGTRS